MRARVSLTAFTVSYMAYFARSLPGEAKRLRP